MKSKLRVGLIGTSERPGEPVSQKVKEIAYRFGYLIAKKVLYFFRRT